MKPVLLLIPGMFNTAAIWDPVRAHLDPGVDVRVANVLTQPSIAAMADDAWAQVAGLPPGTPLIAAGFSMGGYVLIDMLARHAGRVNAAAFIDTSAQIETPDSMAAREKTIAALGRSFERAVSAVIPFSLHPDHHARADLVDGMRAMMHTVGADAAIRQTRAIMARADHRTMLAQLRLPTLVVCGAQDKVTPPELSDDLAALLHGAEQLTLQQAGHQAPLEQPQALAASLMRLVARAL
jgi:pimeloyl-ACP methyl ester carboxylesterase